MPWLWQHANQHIIQILFAGVDFIAAILCPEKTILFPELLLYANGQKHYCERSSEV